MILTEVLMKLSNKNRRNRGGERGDKLMVDDDTDDEFLDSESESIHDIEIITDAFTIIDDLLL